MLRALAFTLLLIQAAAPRPVERTIFADEFAGAAIDRSKWNVIVTGRTVTTNSRPTSIHRTCSPSPTARS